ncbi:unnamed protein product [Arctia plantaginis]|uniref:Uncharacterized protein n=1 Tax=Arctia plantaginis TaxID=874455 RepID=A0A8S1AIY4_ARCPL|nr:unnamed protein product [Arctia plantaginis]
MIGLGYNWFSFVYVFGTCLAVRLTSAVARRAVAPLAGLQQYAVDSLGSGPPTQVFPVRRSTSPKAIPRLCNETVSGICREVMWRDYALPRDSTLKVRGR